ncbi:MAG: flagellar hook-length control protein FliK [Butyrivibrio sp.]|nr:flagellar hook-length control protein FliK [Butyrivibrio sp.]
MSSANNAVGAMAAYLFQGTAAMNVSNVTNVKNSSQTTKNSFDSILNKISDSLNQSRITDASKSVNQSLNSAKQEKTYEFAAKTDNKVVDNGSIQTNGSQEVSDSSGAAATVQTNETQGTEADAKLQEAITEDGKELMAQIADTFDVEEEDILNAMQVLGLMAADLLQPANLQQLVTQLTGQEQAIDLITDSDIYTSLQDLMEGADTMKNELMNEFDLSEEGLQAAIKENNNSFNEQLETRLNEKPEEMMNAFDNRAEVVKEDVNKAKTTAPQSEAFTDTAPEEIEPVEITTQSSKNNSGNKENFQNGAQSSNLFNQLVNNIVDAGTNVESLSQTSYTDRAQMENIIRQITEKITISANAEETSMELSLHPASLGNVNILLTSGKDGIVAKFTAQNQIVKEAVEAQMVQLQQKFNEQGIKVTSIEVTIASHNFEQNLEQGNDRQSQNSTDDRKVKPLRRINLSELEDEEVEELTTDAERIAVQMMAANGNSVDFSA